MKTRRSLFEWMEARSLFAYGDVDLSFGVAGEMRFAPPNEIDSSDRAYTAVLAPDGGLWVAGESDSKSALAKIAPSGRLDTSFSDDGIATYSILGADYRTTITSLHSLSDSRVIICGTIGEPGNRYFVARVLSDGTLDPAFEPWISVNGIRLALLQSQSDDVFAMETDFSDPLGSRSYRVLKFAQNGSLDTQFGDNGATQTVRPTNSQSYVAFANSHPNQIQFGIVEYAYIGPVSPRLLSYRFLENGQVDSNYGTNGRDSVDIPSSAVLSANDWLEIDSNTFLLSHTEFANGRDIQLVQKLSIHNGLDMEFATDGLLELPNPIQSYYGATSLRLNVVENGIVQAVWQKRDNYGRGLVCAAKFSTAGVLDSTFGDHGASTNLIAETNSQLITVLTTSSATFLAGTAFRSSADFWTCALDIHGKLLSAYATAGELKVDFPDLESRVNGFALRGDGTNEFSMISQPSNSIGHFGRMVTRNLQSETLLSRDWNGEINTNSDGEVFRTRTGRTLLAKIVSGNEVYSIVIENADTNGRIDSKARLQIAGLGYMSILKFRETNDGGVLVTGTATGYPHQALLFKLDAFGSLDSSFGEQGVKRLSNLPAFLFDVVEVGSEYWLLMADYFNDSSSLRVVAMNRRGQSIDTFGYNGVLIAISDSFRSRTYYDAVTDGSGGVILLADDNFHLNLIRIDSDGLDRNFGRLGYAVTPIASPARTYPLQHAQIRRSYDRFVIAATVGGPNAGTEISVLDRQGNLVTGFGTSGKVKLDPSIFNDRMADILPLRDGSILVGMTSRSEQGEFGIVQRLLGPDPNPRPYYNIRFPLNVSAAQGDVSVTPLDVLMVVNQLNQRSDPPIGFVDTDGDGEVTPLDVLRIVNFLNRSNLPSNGEGEKPNNNVEIRTQSNFLDIDQCIADWESEDVEVKRKINSHRSRK